MEAPEKERTQKVRINIWHTANEAGVFAVDHGFEVREIQPADLPINEPLLVDVSALREIGDLVMASPRSLGEYMLKRPLVLYMSDGLAIYPPAVDGFSIVSSVVSTADALKSAMCPIQLINDWPKMVDRYGPPAEYPFKQNYEVADFAFPGVLVHHLSECSACTARVMTEALALGFKIKASRFMAEQLAGNLADMFGSVLDSTSGADSGVTIEAAREHVHTCANCHDVMDTEGLSEEERAEQLVQLARSDQNPFGDAQVIELDPNDPEALARFFGSLLGDDSPIGDDPRRARGRFGGFGIRSGSTNLFGDFFGSGR